MSKSISIHPASKLSGTISVPGDKSISHRSILLSGLADTPVAVKNFLNAQDCLSTISCMRSLGVKITQDKNEVITVLGNGLRGLTEPKDILDAGNSGTTMRLMAGILSAMPFFSILTGDHSLRSRPMNRIIEPLSLMGASISAREGGRLAPLAICTKDKLKGIDYISPVASAQIKSCVLLASLVGGCASSITEPFVSRDHTELMLESFGADIKRNKTTVTLNPVKALKAPAEITVPGDISSAAFWLVAASIIPDSFLTLENVGINPTRTGIIDVLKRMGADISLCNQRFSGCEAVADIKVSCAKLNGINVEPEIIPRLIDELPVLAVAALFAEGTTTVKGAGELRVKESDRLGAIAREIGKLGGIVRELPDGFSITGGQKLKWAEVDSHDDHRMAMALSILALAGNGADINDFECVKISYPDFFSQIDKVRTSS